jgi:hypothetical protein
MNASEIRKRLNLRHNPSIFYNRNNAFNSLKHCVKSCYTVILGDCNQFWVVCYADAQRLQKMGYEIAI